MLYSRLVTLALAIAANAQDSSSSSSSSSNSGSSGTTILTGASEGATPTGPYLSYSTTITVLSTSAITTSAIVSTYTTRGSTRTTTLGSTTLFGVGTSIIMASNGTGTSSGSSTTTSPSQLVLSGKASSTMSSNSTGNSTSSSTSSSAQPINTTPCNNYPEFCSRKFSNITEVSAHNSPFVKRGNAAANQELPVTDQLNDGIRLLQGQMHFLNASDVESNPTPHFCHTSCDVLDAGPITSFLGDVYNWVTAHPFDVVTILLGNGRLNNNTYPLVSAYTSYIESTGLVQYAYIPPVIPMARDDWPTLQSMILQGKRVVFFMDYNANQTEVPWLLDEFSQMWETPYDPTNRSFPCTQQRPPDLSEADAKDRLYLANHNLNYDISILGNSLLVPNIPLLNITNNVTGDGSLGVAAQNCNETWGYAPKFLNVDYYNVGNGSVFEVAATYNNVTYNRTCCGLVASAANQVVGRSAILVSSVVVGVSLLFL